jgi:hypothetical protein
MQREQSALLAITMTDVTSIPNKGREDNSIFVSNAMGI